MNLALLCHQDIWPSLPQGIYQGHYGRIASISLNCNVKHVQDKLKSVPFGWEFLPKPNTFIRWKTSWRHIRIKSSSKVSCVIIKCLTSVIFRLGSGDMTVLPVYSTRLPDRFPRKRPCFPLRRWTKPLNGLDNCMVNGGTRTSLFIYWPTSTWRLSQAS